MSRHAFGWVIAAIAAAVLALPVSSHAACSKTKVCSLVKKHIEVADIAESCEMDEDDVSDIAASCPGKGRDRGPDIGPGANPVSTRVPMCCDGFGNSRCPIGAGSTNVGDSCFCPGQGWGFICR